MTMHLAILEFSLIDQFPYFIIHLVVPALPVFNALIEALDPEIPMPSHNHSCTVEDPVLEFTETF
jgi:hypothetical protein